MDSVKSERKIYIDIVKGIAITLVIMGHCYNGIIKYSIYSFHMSLFFVVSGMTMKKGKDILEFVKKRFSNTYIPFIIWSLFYGELTLISALRIIYGSAQSIPWTIGWFLVSIFWGSIIVQAIINHVDNAIACGVIVVLLIVLSSFIHRLQDIPVVFGEKWGLPLNLDVTVYSAAMILFGYCIKDFERLFKNKKVSIAILSSGGVISIVMVYIGIFITQYTIAGRLRFASYDVVNPYLYFLLSGFVSTWIIFCCFFLENIKFLRVFQWLGQNSLGLMVTHTFAKRVISQIDVFSSHQTVSFIGVIIISTICVIVIEKFAPALFGKDFRKDKNVNNIS